MLLLYRVSFRVILDFCFVRLFILFFCIYIFRTYFIDTDPSVTETVTHAGRDTGAHGHPWRSPARNLESTSPIESESQKYVLFYLFFTLSFHNQQLS